MTERIKQLKNYFVKEKKHHILRREVKYDESLIRTIGEMPPHRAMANLLCTVLAAEEPMVFDFERIPFVKTVKNIPYEALTPFLEGQKIHEKGIINNESK